MGHETDTGLADFSPPLQPPRETDGGLTLGLGTVRAQVKDFLQELHTLKKGQAARLSRKNEQVSCLRTSRAAEQGAWQHVERSQRVRRRGRNSNAVFVHLHKLCHSPMHGR